MDNNVDIEDLKITQCSCCEETLLETDDIVIPSVGSDNAMACKACHDEGYTNPNIEYAKCLVLDKVHCPECDEFIAGYIPEDHSYMKCACCETFINIMSYKDVQIKKRRDAKKRV